MQKHLPHLLASVLAAVALALPAAASASPQAVIEECVRTGQVSDHHSDDDKRAALDQLSAEDDAYTDCRSIIGASIKPAGASGPSGLAGNAGPDVGSGGGASDGGGTSGAGDSASGSRERPDRSREEAKQDNRQLARSRTETVLGQRSIDPRTVGAIAAADTANGLSLPVLLALIALLLLLAAAGVVALQRRNPAFAEALRRVSLPRRRG